jgi:hypothetical protein
MANSFTVRFSGVCDFVAQLDGTILVLLPEAGSPPVKDVRPHSAFLRVKRRDIDAAKTTVVFDATMSDAEYGILLLRGHLLRLAGPFTADSLSVDPTFTNNIPRMDDIGETSAPQTSEGIAARMVIDKGLLSAGPTARGAEWVFKPYGKPELSEADRAALRPFFNRVYLDLVLDESADTPIRVLADKEEIVFPSPAGVELVIGNLEGDLKPRKGPYKMPIQDLDFLFHYALSPTRREPEERLVPTCPPEANRGDHGDCVPASWGGIRPGIQRPR